MSTRATIAFARQGEREGTAEEYMRRFYEYVREPTGGRYDPGRASQLEVSWWVVHRNRDRYADRSVLTEAVASLYAEVYQAPLAKVLPDADARAAAMDLSDRWIGEGEISRQPIT